MQLLTRLLALIAATFVTWTCQRVTAIALPLVTVAQTHSMWATGMVGGAAAVPLVLSPWWARRLRQRVASGAALALVLLVQAAGVLLVPLAANTVGVTVPVLCASGLVAGTASALGGPAQRALTADIAEPLGSASVGRALAVQDFAHRVSMVFAPALGAWAVTAFGSTPTLWCEGAGLVFAALLVTGVRGRRCAAPSERADASPGMLQVLRRRRDLAAGAMLSAVGGGTWFALTLGLALLGVEQDQPGVLVAAGMSGYGIGSVSGAFVAPLLVNRVPKLATTAFAWLVLAGAYLALPAVSSSLVATAVVAGLGGALMPLGIATLASLIASRTSGAERRTAFAAESLAGDGSAAVGLLAGGALIGAFGAGPVMVTCGLILACVAAPIMLWAVRVHDVDSSSKGSSFVCRVGQAGFEPATDGL